MPVQPFDRSFFESSALDCFWQMITERMRIYWRRMEGMPPPWTNDKILSEEFITNVYRELDPGTEHILSSVIQREDLTPENKLFNIVIYRLMGSRVEFHQHLEPQDYETYDPEQFEADCRQVWDTYNLSPFGEAYRTASYSDMGTADKLTNVCRLMAVLAAEIPNVWQEVSSAATLEKVYSSLEKVQGLGDFLAYQVMVDLLYPAPFEPMVPFDLNTWAKAGPGARRGVWALMKPGMKPQSMMEVMTWLRDNQQSEFERLGLDFPYPTDPTSDDDEPMLIPLCDIQSCLCEFYKYYRIWVGDAKAVRRYTYQERLTNSLEEESVVVATPPSKVEGVSGVVVGALGPEDSGSGEHVSLRGSAVAGSLQLQLGGSDDLEGDGSLPKSVADHTGQVVGAQVHELAASGTTLDHYPVRGVGLHGSGHLPPDVVDALLQAVRSGGLDSSVVENLLASYGHYSGTGQGQVQAQDGSVHVSPPAGSRITHISVDFS